MTHEPYPFIEDRPTLWPHPPSEKQLPALIEQLLADANSCVATDRQRASALSEEAIWAARQHLDGGVLPRSLYYVASLMRRAGRPDRAYMLCLETQPLLERLDDRWRATKALQLRARCCLNVGEHERALVLLAEAAERFEKLPDVCELARCRELAATAHSLAGDPPAAVASADEALATLPPGDYPAMERRLRQALAHCRLKWGEQLASAGDGPGAAAQFALATAALPTLGDDLPAARDPVVAALLDTVVRIAMVRRDEAAVRTGLLRLLAWARRFRHPADVGTAWLRMAEHRRVAGRRCSAVACARRAAVHLGRVPRHRGLPASLQLQADLLEAEHDLQGAYTAYLQATAAESDQQREAIALRAEILALDEAEEESRKTEQTLAYAQRMSNVGHLVASVNHELNQPMASIRMLAETALELMARGENAEVLDNLRTMLKLSTRLNELASKLGAFPVQPSTTLQPTGLSHAIDEALVTLRSRLVRTPCAIVRERPGLVVLAHEGQLVRVISNLVNNALDVLAGHAAPSLQFVCSSAGGVATLTVVDNGPGLSAAVRERLFQPFFSTKAAGQGLGLGLALSRNVMREMGGDLAVASSSVGAAFDVTLPMAPRPG